MTDESTFLERLTPVMDLPDGAMATEGVAVMGWIDPEGEPKFSIKIAGDTSHTQILGLLTAAAHDIMHRMNPTPCERDD